MTDDAAPQVPVSPEEEQAYRLLAYYDAREVSDMQLCRIFSATAADIVNARQHPKYAEFLAEETAKIEEISARITDRWANLEDRALGDLSDAMDSIADPRMLLGIAVQANKARATARTAARAQQKGSMIDLDSGNAPGPVIRIRTGIADKISKDGGITRMIEREMVIRQSSGMSINEAMDPTGVKTLLKTALGIDTGTMHTVKQFGPDISIDFSGLDTSNG